MRYSLDQFEAVAEEIEEQGGALLTEPCMPLDVTYTSPPYKRKRVDRKFSCGCRNTTRFAVEYNDENGRTSIVTACAICDDLGLWPRFQHAFVEAGGSL